MEPISYFEQFASGSPCVCGNKSRPYMIGWSASEMPDNKSGDGSCVILSLCHTHYKEFRGKFSTLYLRLIKKYIKQ